MTSFVSDMERHGFDGCTTWTSLQVLRGYLAGLQIRSKSNYGGQIIEEMRQCSYTCDPGRATQEESQHWDFAWSFVFLSVLQCKAGGPSLWGDIEDFGCFGKDSVYLCSSNEEHPANAVLCWGEWVLPDPSLALGLALKEQENKLIPVKPECNITTLR